MKHNLTNIAKNVVTAIVAADTYSGTTPTIRSTKDVGSNVPVVEINHKAEGYKIALSGISNGTIYAIVWNTKTKVGIKHGRVAINNLINWLLNNERKATMTFTNVDLATL